MKRISLWVLAAAAILALADPGWARDGGGGMGYFAFGWRQVDVDELNVVLKGKGYPAFSDGYFLLGGGGHAVIRYNLIVGGEGHGLVRRQQSGLARRTSISGGYGFFNVGYSLYRTDELRVYPLLGLGGGSLQLDISERAVTSFGQILDDPGRSAQVSTGGLLLDLALGADYLLALREDKDSQSGMVFGLRAGYTWAPLKGEWRLAEADVAEGPPAGIEGAYVRLVIGRGTLGK